MGTCNGWMPWWPWRASRRAPRTRTATPPSWRRPPGDMCLDVLTAKTRTVGGLVNMTFTKLWEFSIQKKAWDDDDSWVFFGSLQVELLSLLLKRQPDSCLLGDADGDTALHHVAQAIELEAKPTKTGHLFGSFLDGEVWWLIWFDLVWF